MSVTNTITDNSMTSAVVGGKTLTRRTEGGQVIYDGFIDTSGGGGSGSGIGEIRRYPVTSNGALDYTGKAISRGTGITVPPEVSAVYIFGAEMALYGDFPCGASIPRNTGSHTWWTVQGLDLQGGTGQGASLVYWGLPADGSSGSTVENKIYANTGPYSTITSLWLLFV
jgi:hypothetical protein